jgi:hypothetical protein
MNFARVNGQDVPVDDEPSAAALALEAGKGFAGQFNPLPLLKALYGAGVPSAPNVGGLAALGEGVVNAHADQFHKGKAAFDDGRYSEAIAHTVAGLIPLIGPAAAHAGEAIGTGDPRQIAHGVGETAGLLAPMAVAHTNRRSTCP